MSNLAKSDYFKDFMFCRHRTCNAQARIGTYYCGRHQRFESELPKAAPDEITSVACDKTPSSLDKPSRRRSR